MHSLTLLKLINFLVPKKFCKNHKDNRSNKSFKATDENLFTDQDQLAAINGDQHFVEHHVFKGK